MEIQGNISAGYGNSITGGTKSSIVGGEGNSNSATQSFIGGGYNNTVSGVYGSSVVGGRDNTVDGSYYASVVGGRGNQISGGINTYSTIVGGDYNLITNTSRRSFIGNGTSNEISGSTKSSIVGGDDNYMSEGFTNFGHLFIGGGQNNTIFKTNWSTIGGGYGNTIDKLDIPEIQSSNNFIGGGFDNHIYNGAYSTIGGGYQNYINAGTYNYSTIGGGQSNQIIGYSISSSILGGRNNIISNYSSYGTLLGGRNNTITGATYSSVLGGQSNTVSHNNSHIIGSNITSIGVNTTHVESLNIENGLSIPSSTIAPFKTDPGNLTIADYYVRSTLTGTTDVRLPNNPSGSNESRNGQILIISQGDIGGTLRIFAGIGGAIEEPGSSTNRDQITLNGPNSNVTLYYDGDASKWVVTSETGVVTYQTNI